MPKTPEPTSSRPPSSLAPETRDIDLDWDDDLPDTRSPSGLPTVQPEAGAHPVSDRVTTLPEIPTLKPDAQLLDDSEPETGLSHPECDRKQRFEPPVSSFQYPSTEPTLPPQAPPLFKPDPKGHPHKESSDRVPGRDTLLDPVEPAFESSRFEPARHSSPWGADERAAWSGPGSEGMGDSEAGSVKKADPSYSESACAGRISISPEQRPTAECPLPADLQALPASRQSVQEWGGTASDRGRALRESVGSRERLRELYAIGDFSGALELAERLLANDPQDSDAARYATSCRDVLTTMLSNRIGRLDRRVRIVLGPDQIRWLSLDHRAGFVLSLIDGSLTVEDLLEVSAMPQLEVLRILTELLDRRVIAFDPVRDRK